jgi:hypothetical protein
VQRPLLPCVRLWMVAKRPTSLFLPGAWQGRWVPFEVGECDGNGSCGSASRFRHTLTRIALREADPTAAGSSSARSPQVEAQVLLAVGGMPTRHRTHTSAGLLAPRALVCWLTPSREDQDAGCGGSTDDGDCGRMLKIDCRHVRVDGGSPSWVVAVGSAGARLPEREEATGQGSFEGAEMEGRASVVGWIGHTACEDGSGRVLVYGGAPCKWSGLELQPSSEMEASLSRDVLRLELCRQAAGRCLSLRVDVLEDTRSQGCSTLGPGARFAHSACLLRVWDGQKQEERCCMMVQGGCLLHAAGGAAPHAAATDAYLLDIAAGEWRSMRFQAEESRLGSCSRSGRLELPRHNIVACML